VARRFARQKFAAALAVFAALGSVSCTEAPAAEVSDRIWISALPAGPRDSFSAVVLTSRANKGLGMFYQGSIYRGGYDLVSWKSQGVGRFQLELLQTKSRHEIRSEPCQPAAGFDYCVRLIGDPSGTVRYYSRKRWTLRRKAKGASELNDEVQAILSESLGLADESEESPANAQ
jgi:hypothetical protein